MFGSQMRLRRSLDEIPSEAFYLTIICHPLVRRFMYEDVELPPLLEKLNRLINIIGWLTFHRLIDIL